MYDNKCLNFYRNVFCLCFTNKTIPASPSISCCCVTESHVIEDEPLGLCVNTHMSEYLSPEGQ